MKHVVADIYRFAQSVNKPSENMPMKVVTFRNFSLQKVENLQVQDLQEKIETTVTRQTEDFYGGEDDSKEQM